MKYRIYLDDVRTPIDNDWVVVRDYDEFVTKVQELGLENIETISLDHDLGISAMGEYHFNVSPNYTLDYNNITEKTGYDCAKWLVNYFYNTRDKVSHTEVDGEFMNNPVEGFIFPTVYVHSANPIGSANILGYINNFLMNEDKPQTCVRVRIQHT